MLQKMPSAPDMLDFTRASIVSLVEDDRAEIIALLRRYGVTINEATITDNQLISALGVASSGSKAFRASLAALMKEKAAGHLTYKNYVDERMFMNEDGDAASPTEAQPAKKSWEDTFVGSILSKDRLGNMVDFGLGVWGNSIQAKTQREGLDSATSYELAQAEKYKKQADNNLISGGNKWLMPVIIVLVLGLVGTGIYFAIKKSAGKKAAITK